MKKLLKSIVLTFVFTIGYVFVTYGSQPIGMATPTMHRPNELINITQQKARKICAQMWRNEVSRGCLIGGNYALADNYSPTRVIVIFNTNPASVQIAEAEIQGFSLSEHMAENLSESDHTLFRQELSSLFRGRTRTQTYTITHEYRRALNGVSMTLPSNMVTALANFSSVRAVFPDTQVNVTPPDIQTARNPQGMSPGRATMGADDMHLRGYKGCGVLIAVLDTGIDYYHPAFAGSFPTLQQMQQRNPNITEADLQHGYFKGRNFVNDGRASYSPMETLNDTDHGTHVAGTIAGRDTGGEISIRGVAPQAQMIHYRVLGQGGSGWDSDIIAAIEKVTYDRPDVVNMSLGALINSPIDPMSIAVTNVKLANPYITFVIAAGNDWWHNTVGSPATSALAITVGSADVYFEYDGYNIRRSSFSSRGPVGISHEIKPDIMAHGGNVLSALPEWSGRRVYGSLYGYMPGTSMAAPHVAGAVAVLVEYSRINHGSTWSSEEIKARIMNNAMPMQSYYSVFDIGAGYIDVYAAANNSTVVFTYNERVITHTDAFTDNDFATARTGSFSFGGAFSLDENIQRSITATVINNGLETEAYTIRYVFTNNAENAATLAFSHEILTINSGEYANFYATITIDANARPSFYEGFIYVEHSEGIAARLPFAFVAVPLPEVEYILPYVGIVGEWYHASFSINNQTSEWVIEGNLPPGLETIETEYLWGYNILTLWGTPTQAGDFSFTVKTEGSGLPLESEVNIQVRYADDVNLYIFECPNFLGVVREITGIKTGPITPEDVANITAISSDYTWGRSIASLVGIEYFTELHLLDIRNNRLTHLDLSNNTHLFHLDACLNGLTELKLSENPHLSIVRVEDNFLTQLDVSNNYRLYSLRVAWNYLQYLNLTNSPVLHNLFAESNMLASINFHNNTSPSWLLLQENSLIELGFKLSSYAHTLAVSNNPLRRLDLSNGSNLRYLAIWGSPLKQLDLSNNALLQMLQVVQTPLSELNLANKAELTFLNAFQNSLTQLDISNTHTLNVVNNFMTSINDISGIENVLGNIYFEPQRSILPPEGAVDVTADFECPNFLSLVRYTTGIFDRPIFNADLGYFSDLVGVGRNITSIAGIEHFINISQVVLSNNNIRIADFSHNPRLTCIFIRNNELTHIDVSQNINLGRLVVNNNFLTSIDLTNNKYLWLLYAENNELTAIDLSYIKGIEVYGMVSLRIRNNLMISPWDILIDWKQHPLLLSSPSFKFFPQRQYAPFPAITLTQGGYLTPEQPTPITIINIGNQPINQLNIQAHITSPEYNTPADAFIITPEIITSLEIGENAVFTITPRTGLEYGIHTARVIVSGNRVSAYVDVIFENPDPNTPPIEITQYFTCPNFLQYVRNLPNIPPYPYPIMNYHVASIPRLTPHGQNITSLAGIQHFTNLTQLQAQNNPYLKNLSISGLYRLENIVVQGSGIKTLTLYNLPSLTHLNAAHNNLTALTLTRLPDLRGLSISDNNLYGERNLTRLPSLRIVWMENNNLNSVDVTGLEYLTMLDVRGNLMPDYEAVIGINLSPLPADYTPTPRHTWQRPRISRGFAFYGQRSSEYISRLLLE